MITTEEREMNRKIFALTPEDPAFKNGARYAVCEPAWAEYAEAENKALVVVAYAKCATLEDARRLSAGGGVWVFSTYPGGLSADFSWEFK